jgi:hypothetical protein
MAPDIGTAFRKLITQKNRVVVFTNHAVARSSQRILPKSVVEFDLLNSVPAVVIEQESEVKGERKFNVYYFQREGLFHRYVVCINSQIRVITMLRSSKKLQGLLARGLK